MRPACSCGSSADLGAVDHLFEAGKAAVLDAVAGAVEEVSSDDGVIGLVPAARIFGAGAFDAGVEFGVDAGTAGGGGDAPGTEGDGVDAGGVVPASSRSRLGYRIVFAVG